MSSWLLPSPQQQREGRQVLLGRASPPAARQGHPLAAANLCCCSLQLGAQSASGAWNERQAATSSSRCCRCKGVAPACSRRTHRVTPGKPRNRWQLRNPRVLLST
jgi:hypothetical protein